MVAVVHRLVGLVSASVIRTFFLIWHFYFYYWTVNVCVRVCGCGGGDCSPEGKTTTAMMVAKKSGEMRRKQKRAVVLCPSHRLTRLLLAF